MSTSKPVRIEVHAYQVGFGDCFLVRFEYPNRARHVLIDFGTTGTPKTATSTWMEDIAKDIGIVCNNKLDAVVATHRHMDHVSGFSETSKSGKLIASYKPEVVIQPWTEDPKAAVDARAPTSTIQDSQAFVRSLGSMHEVASAALAEIGSSAASSPFGKLLTKELRFLGEDNLANAAAVKNLMKMSKRRVYAHFGSASGLKSLLPGVRVTVLGPPTLEQSAAISVQRSKDDAEFWHFQAAAGRVARSAARRPFSKKHALRAVPPYARWFVPRMLAIRGDQLLEIVRILDEAMNNTSLILLFEVGGEKLLFSGDAQLENWLYCLKTAPNAKQICSRLKKVTFYKVGHHGSLNATPKESLWKIFGKAAASGAGRLKTVVSTLKGKHGSTAKGTEVPRGVLIDALEQLTDFKTTESLTGKKAPKHVIPIPI